LVLRSSCASGSDTVEPDFRPGYVVIAGEYSMLDSIDVSRHVTVTGSGGSNDE
jgi:hypothetical protein